MKVGDIEVNAHTDGSVKLKLTTGLNYVLEFERQHGNRYHAELEANDIYQGLRQVRRELQREVIDNLARQKLPGARRGKLRQAIDMVRRIYGL